MARLRYLGYLSGTTLLLMLAGCAQVGSKPSPPSNQGESSYQLASDQKMEHYALPVGSTVTGGVPLKHPAPIYPASLLTLCPAPVTLKALLIVGTDGMVSEVRAFDATSVDPAFVAAVRAATQQWRFEPLQFNHWAADANGQSHDVDSDTKPFSLTYTFNFACHDGKPQTSAGAASTGA
jgi:hypothetical protein